MLIVGILMDGVKHGKRESTVGAWIVEDGKVIASAFSPDRPESHEDHWWVKIYEGLSEDTAQTMFDKAVQKNGLDLLTPKEAARNWRQHWV